MSRRCSLARVFFCQDRCGGRPGRPAWAPLGADVSLAAGASPARQASQGAASSLNCRLLTLSAKGRRALMNPRRAILMDTTSLSGPREVRAKIIIWRRRAAGRGPHAIWAPARTSRTRVNSFLSPGAWWGRARAGPSDRTTGGFVLRNGRNLLATKCNYNNGATSCQHQRERPFSCWPVASVATGATGAPDASARPLGPSSLHWRRRRGNASAQISLYRHGLNK